ncbi:hypothetical protein [Chryseobacterium foetidum]|uniref:hypothetical protein n=1 Tax=Chryseobacterium foetidum TaxID=2951057 RepID=UPI0021C75EF2|nr:hypothetical protein [Chryseobacterium foetidum]
MKTFFLRFLFVILGINYYAQSGSVGIGTETPNSSAILDLVATNKGIMLPQIALNASNVSDASFMATTPTTSLLVYNTNASFPGGRGLYYWDGGKWVFYFNSANLNLLLGITKYYSKIYPGGTYTFSYPGESPYVNGSSLALPWVKVPETTDFDIVIDRPENNTVITFTGMVQVGTASTSANVNYGLGIFVDNKLITSKAVSLNGDIACPFQEFTITGVLDDLSVGTHKITLGVANRTGNVGSELTYYGRKAGGCLNLTNDEAQISAVVLINQPLPY